MTIEEMLKKKEMLRVSIATMEAIFDVLMKLSTKYRTIEDSVTFVYDMKEDTKKKLEEL